MTARRLKEAVELLFSEKWIIFWVYRLLLLLSEYEWIYQCANISMRGRTIFPFNWENVVRQTLKESTLFNFGIDVYYFYHSF